MPAIAEPPQSRIKEPLPVQLTRMEGVLNLIAERGINTDRRVDGHASEIGSMKVSISNLQSETQTLREGADADKKTAVALALALKEADETRRTKSEQSWSPITRLFAVLTTVATLLGVYFYFAPH